MTNRDNLVWFLLCVTWFFDGLNFGSGDQAWLWPAFATGLLALFLLWEERHHTTWRRLTWWWPWRMKIRPWSPEWWTAYRYHVTIGRFPSKKQMKQIRADVQDKIDSGEIKTIKYKRDESGRLVRVQDLPKEP